MLHDNLNRCVAHMNAQSHGHSADSTMARSRLPSCNATRRPLVARFATTPVTVSSVARQWACGTPHDWYRSHDGDDGGDGGGGEGINETLE